MGLDLGNSLKLRLSAKCFSTERKGPRSLISKSGADGLNDRALPTLTSVGRCSANEHMV